jgi:hypothetical protein
MPEECTELFEEVKGMILDGTMKAPPATECENASFFGNGCIGDQEAVAEEEITLEDGTVKKLSFDGSITETTPDGKKIK